MDAETLIELTPPEFYVIPQRRRQANEKGGPDMALFYIEDCVGKTIKDMFAITVSKVKEIISGDTRIGIC